MAPLGPDFPLNDSAADQLATGLPFIHLQLVEDAEFAIPVGDFFATDCDTVAKVVVEVEW